MARKLSSVGIFAMCGVLALVAWAAPVHAADPPYVIDLPGGTWSGVETVTVTDSSPETKSFAVSISRSTFLGAQTYVREPNTTPGQPVAIQVPTWGWHGQVYVAVSFCTTLTDYCVGGSIASVRTVAQDPADAVTADLEVPVTPVLLPEEHSFVTLHNPGGGRLYLGPTDTGAITAGERTEITWPDRNEPADLQAARCPPGFDPQSVADVTPTSCEFFDLHRSVVAFDVLRMSAFGLHNRVITDPVAPEGTSVRIVVVGYRQVAQRIEYELDDASGTAVIGPVTWQPAYNPGPGYTPLRLEFDPTAEAGRTAPRR